MDKKFFYTPWDPSVMATGEALEYHNALCRAAGLPPTTPPGALPAVQGDPTVAHAQWRAMCAHRTKGTHEGSRFCQRWNPASTNI